jgi:hypothetical protein
MTIESELEKLNGMMQEIAKAQKGCFELMQIALTNWLEQKDKMNGVISELVAEEKKTKAAVKNTKTVKETVKVVEPEPVKTEETVVEPETVKVVEPETDKVVEPEPVKVEEPVKEIDTAVLKSLLVEIAKKFGEGRVKDIIFKIGNAPSISAIKPENREAVLQECKQILA